MANIQDNYGSGMEAGQVGLVSRPNAPYNGERIQIGASGLFPGSAFKLNGSGKAVPMTGEDDASRVEGVLSYEASMVNNAAGVIAEYAVNDWVAYVEEGYVYGVAGEALARGDQLAYDPADKKWHKSTLAVVDQNKIMTAATAAGINTLFEVKIGARVAPNADTTLAAAIADLQPMSHGASFVIGTEGSNAIIVTVNLLDGAGDPVEKVQVVTAYLSDAATGIGVAATAPNGGVVAGNMGVVMHPVIAAKIFLMQSNASGVFKLVLTESGIDTFYVCVVLADGTIKVSGAVTFA